LEALRDVSAASDLLDAAVAQRLNMTRTDLRCLDYLARAGPVPASQLADAVGLTRGALTIAVDRQVHAGYVRRRADSSDRRRVLIQLTRKADRVIALFADLAAATDQLLRSYSETDLDLLTTFLTAASAALANQARAVVVRRGESRHRRSSRGSG
jgi:DNA-binding MarR family transcriptional regulator